MLISSYTTKDRLGILVPHGRPRDEMRAWSNWPNDGFKFHIVTRNRFEWT